MSKIIVSKSHMCIIYAPSTKRVWYLRLYDKNLRDVISFVEKEGRFTEEREEEIIRSSPYVPIEYALDNYEGESE